METRRPINKHGVDIKALQDAIWDYRRQMSCGGWDSIGIHGVYREDGIDVLDSFFNFIENDEIPIEGVNAIRCNRCGKVTCHYKTSIQNYCDICWDDLGFTRGGL